MSADKRITVSAEKMQCIANTINEQKDTMGDILTQIDASMGNVFSNSEGKAIEQLEKKYEEVRTAYEAIMKYLENFAEAALKTGEMIAQVDVDIMGALTQ